jgi:hypothetical protein
MANPSPTLPSSQSSRTERAVDISAVNPRYSLRNARKILTEYKWVREHSLDTLSGAMPNGQNAVVSTYLYRISFLQRVEKRLTVPLEEGILSEPGSGFDDPTHGNFIVPEPSALSVVDLPTNIPAAKFENGERKWMLEEYQIKQDIANHSVTIYATLTARTKFLEEPGGARVYVLPAIADVPESETAN